MMKLFAVVLILLGVANNHPANGTFLFHNPQTGTGSVIAATIGLPRGGGGGNGSKQTSAPKKQTLTVQSMKETLNEMIEQPSSGSTLALGQSLILYLAGMLTLYGVNKIRDLYPTQRSFYSGVGSSDGRLPAWECCQQKKSILYAWPGTVSESISDLNGITAKIVGSYLTFSALLILSSQLGRPSAFPIKAGHFKSIFNVVRMILPTIALYFVPRVNFIGIEGVHSPGQMQQGMKYHNIFALSTMVLVPLLEMIVVVHSLISFFKDPKSNNFFPSDNDSDADSSKAWVGTLYKSLWVGLTVLRGAMCVGAVWVVYQFFSVMYGSRSTAIHTDACGVLDLIKGFSLEVAIISLVGGIYAALALTQMCESSGRNLSSLIYIVPFLMFFSKLFMPSISTFLLTFDMKKNYLAIVNMPGGRFSEAVMGTFNSYLGQLQSQDGTVTKLPTGTTLMHEYFKDCSAKFPDSELDMCP